jgi:glycosyltransferase involved in cell wall biosynthesis
MLSSNGERFSKETILSKAVTATQQSITLRPYEFVSTFSVSTIKLDEIEVFQPDVIHIHNWYNQLSFGDLVEIGNRYPLVFTLHDQRLFTGGCHYAYECFNYLEQCSKCPAVRFGKSLVSKNKKDMSNLWTNLGRYGVVSPSEWLVRNPVQLGVLNNAFEVKVIPNVIEGKFYESTRPNSEDDNQTLKMVFIASKVYEEIKGFRVLTQAIQELIRDGEILEENFELIVIGDINGSVPKEPYITYLGEISALEVANIFYSATVCVIPSILDNLPSVIPEAQLCKLFVIGSAVGGIPELIKDNVTGLLFDPDVESLATCIKKYKQLSEAHKNQIRNTAYDIAKRTLNPDKITSSHDAVYKKILFTA